MNTEELLLRAWNFYFNEGGEPGYKTESTDDEGETGVCLYYGGTDSQRCGIGCILPSEDAQWLEGGFGSGKNISAVFAELDDPEHPWTKEQLGRARKIAESLLPSDLERTMGLRFLQAIQNAHDMLAIRKDYSDSQDFARKMFKELRNQLRAIQLEVPPGAAKLLENQQA